MAKMFSNERLADINFPKNESSWEELYELICGIKISWLNERAEVLSMLKDCKREMDNINYPSSTRFQVYRGGQIFTRLIALIKKWEAK